MGYYDELKRMADSTGMPSTILENTITFSDSIVAVVMRWSKKDNYAQTRSAEKYSVTDEEGRWVPTPPMYAQAIEPIGERSGAGNGHLLNNSCLYAHQNLM